MCKLSTYLQFLILALSFLIEISSDVFVPEVCSPKTCVEFIAVLLSFCPLCLNRSEMPFI